MGDTAKLSIGVIMSFNPKWMGGVIYCINAVKILNWLPEEEKPVVKLFYRADLQRFVDEIDYPYLEPHVWEFPTLSNGYIRSWLRRENIFIAPILAAHQLDALFPVMDFPLSTKTDTKLVSWYADLQHKYYPQFFSRRKLLERDARIKLILRHTKHLVVSSEAVKNDFTRFFNIRPTTEMPIFHFASVIDSFDFTAPAVLRDKFKLPEHYFIVSNQFHKHKNHQVVLDALVRLKQKGIRPFVAMTGRLPEDLNSSHIRKLRATITEHDLDAQVSFLGVVPRAEQLSLMHYSQAVIQPSLFEGWSTVIEDAISVQVPVIAANLEVNIEQLKENGIYFSPHDEEGLAHIFENYPIRTTFDQEIYEPYDEHIKKAARSFIQLFK